MSKQAGDEETGMSARDFAVFQHDYVFKNIAAADNKAIAVLAINSGLIAYVSQNRSYVSWIRVTPMSGSQILAALATLALIISAAFALKVLWPNLRGSPRGIVYWRAVASFQNAEAYSENVQGRTEETLIHEVLRHAFDVSKVCARKFHCLRISLWAGLIGVVALFGDFAWLNSR
jgi:hypothetical protein